MAFLLIIEAHKRDVRVGAEALRVRCQARLVHGNDTPPGRHQYRPLAVRCRGGKVGKDKRWPGFGVAGLGHNAAVCQDAGGGVSMQGYLAAMSDDVVKGAFYEEMKEKGDLLWFTKDDTKARAL
jgi:hypothetical protein